MTQHQNRLSKVYRLPAALLLSLGLFVAGCGDGGAKAPASADKTPTGAAAPAAPANPADDQPIPGVPLDDMAQGPVDAAVTVIEFASMTCPHCAHFEKETYPLIKRDYIDTGKIRYIFREFPLDTYAVDASILARCTGSADSYFAVIDKLFAEQPEWMPAPGPVSDVSRGATQDRLLDYGKPYGVTKDKFKACLANKPLKDHLANRMDEAKNRHNVQGTPTVVVNGTPTKSPSYQDVAQAIQDALKK